MQSSEVTSVAKKGLFIGLIYYGVHCLFCHSYGGVCRAFMYHSRIFYTDCGKQYC